MSRSSPKRLGINGGAADSLPEANGNETLPNSAYSTTAKDLIPITRMSVSYHLTLDHTG